MMSLLSSIGIIMFICMSKSYCSVFNLERESQFAKERLSPKAPFGNPFELVQAIGDKKRNVTQTLLDFHRDFHNRLKGSIGNNSANILGAFTNKKRNVTQTVVDFKRDFYNRLKGTTGTGANPTTISQQSINIEAPVVAGTNEVNNVDIDFIIEYLKQTYLKDQIQTLQLLQKPQQEPSQSPFSQNSFLSLSGFNSLADIPLADSYSQEYNSYSPTDYLIELLTKIQQPINKNLIDYSDDPYIPAIHGDPNNSNFFFSHGLNVKDTSVKTAALNTISDSEASTHTTRISGSLSTCMEQSGCILAVALLVAAGTTSAIGIPLMFGKRKKRSAHELTTSVNDTLSIINYHNQITDSTNQSVSSSLFQLLSGVQSPNHQSDIWKNHQDSANFLSVRNINGTLSDTAAKVTEYNEYKLLKLQNKLELSKGLIGRNSNDGKISDKENYSSTHNFKLISFDLNEKPQSTPEIKSRKEHQASEDLLPLDNISMDEDKKNSELLKKLQIQLRNYFTQISNSHKQINISSNFENSTKTSNFPRKSQDNFEENYAISPLRVTLNDIMRNNKDIQDIVFHLQDLPNKLDLLQQEKQLSIASTNPDSSVRPFQGLRNNLFQIINELNSKPELGHDRITINMLLNLILRNRFSQNYQRPTNSNRLSLQQLFASLGAGSSQQPTVPKKTVANIIQNPNINPNRVHSILSKLPQLVTGQNLGPIRTRPNPTFSPTVIVKPGSPEIVQKPEKITIQTQQVNNLLSNAGISTETRKFYSLLCRAILQPNIPLNRITAYIAEKCIVLRLTGIASL